MSLSVRVYIPQAEVDRFTEWSRHVVFGPSTLGQHVRMHVFKPSACEEPEQQAQALSIQLALLRAMRLQPSTKVEICVKGWGMTEPVKAALQGLPEWSNTTVKHV